LQQEAAAIFDAAAVSIGALVGLIAQELFVGFLQRMGPARAGRQIKWQRVRRVTPREIVCSD
jgi:hypothetical protein